MCNSHNAFLYSLISLKSKLVKAADHLAFLAVENEVYCMDPGDFLLAVCLKPTPGGFVGAILFILGIFYCVSGQLKTMLDRANPLFDTDYAFTKAYLLATAAEDAPETFAGTEKTVQGWVDCFPRCVLAGTVFAGGVNGVGEIAGHIALEQAYQMGKEV